MTVRELETRIASLKMENESLAQQVKRLIIAEGQLYQYQEELDKQLKEYKDLYELNKKLNATFDIDKMFAYAVAYATQNLEYERAILFHRLGEAGGYRVGALDGYYNPDEKRCVNEVVIETDAPLLAPLLAGRECLIYKTGTEERILLEYREKLCMDEYLLCPLGPHLSPHAILAVGNSAESSQFYRKISDSTEMLLNLGNLVELASSAVERFIYHRKMEIALEQERLAEEKYRSIFENAVEGIFQTTPEGYFLGANPSMSRMLGYSSPAELMSAVTDIKRQHYVDPERRLEFQLAVEGNSTVEGFEAEFFRKDGSILWISMSARVVRNEYGQILYYEGTAEDITKRKRAEEALRESEERYRVVSLTALDGIISIDEESRIVLTNPAVEKIFGYSNDELLGKPVTVLMPERLREAHINGVKRYITTGKRALNWGKIEMPGLHKDGREIPLELSYGEFIKNGRFSFVGFIRDLSERKQAEETIKFRTYHDLLTGLPNRQMFTEHLAHEISEMERVGKKLGVLFLDVDNFKTVNDSLGHTAGNDLIREVSGRLRGCIHEFETVARIGGDEFSILLPLLDKPEEASRVAEMSMGTFAKPFVINNHELSLTASIGISIYPDDGKDADSLLKKADIALHHAKERGRNNLQFFNDSINFSTIERIIFENRLRKAVERNELVIFYQPQQDLKSGKIAGMEALVRWNHPDLGLLQPMQFIPLAEESGLIIEIDQWVLRTACEQLKAWELAGYGHLSVATNLSSRQFQQPDLAKIISNILKETELKPDRLGIEITETLAMQDTELTMNNLGYLNTLGVRFHIDDFGTGYSSLSYLKRMPIQKLKIDKSFINGLVKDPDYEAIVNAVIAMAHSMKLRVVAEGVETEGQMSFLQAKECDEIQGFLYSKPVPADKLEEFFLSRVKL